MPPERLILMKKTQIMTYNGNIETITESKKTPHFFAASNSREGFVSYFERVFGGDDIKRLYILQGGPGSGKSTMMKQVAKISEKEGFTTEYIHCSSSPFSLDGVIVKEKGIAVIDGTEPHTYKVSMPGAREISIDPGLAWDTDKLFARREEIRALCEKKKTAYRKAYIYLRAACLIADEMKESVKPHILEEKLLKSADIQMKNLSAKKPSVFSEKVRIQRGVSGQGSVYFESLFKSADTSILVKDSHGVAQVYFKALYDAAKRQGLSITVSCSPEDPSEIDGILFDDASVCYSLYCKANESDKIINCERFADKKGISDIKQKYNFSLKCKSSLEDEAYKALHDAAEFHEMIEEKYKPCTDYSVTEKISSELCRRIFGNY